MSKKIVIVESPAKCKTIKKYLGKDFTIVASFGHIRDLPRSKLGINVDTDYEPSYDTIEDKQKVIQDLKKHCKGADTVYIATDPDREGEAIAWHLEQALDLKKTKTHRVVFNQITKSAVQKAIENPRSIDQNLVDAQQARRILDRMVGFEISPILWRKIRTGLSAGRVQSVAVRIIVEKEKEIRLFKLENYYKVTALFETDEGIPLDAEINEKLLTQKSAKSLLKTCSSAALKINSIKKRKTERKPPPPFITSTLQQEASQKYGNSVSKTMTLAQRLYEAGHITYMRTDSVSLAQEALDQIKKYIISTFGKEYATPQNYKTKSSSAQEAHEAIRPTKINEVTVSDDPGEQKLYDLIRKRTIASQMSIAQVEKTTAIVDIPKEKVVFQAKGEIILFDGFLKIYHDNTSSTENALPQLSEDQPLILKDITATERFTRPPARFSEASLVKKLEELAIGRPSTYAPTISTIQKRGYVENMSKEGEERQYSVISIKKDTIVEDILTETTGSESKRLCPQDIGFLVNDFLVDQFDTILDYHFTANLEQDFDEIAVGKKKWKSMIKTFYTAFHKNVLHVKETAERVSGERLLGQDPKSGKNVFVRMGRFGPLAQIGESAKDGTENKPRFAGLHKTQSLDTITLSDALELFKLPREVGEFEGTPIIAAIGRFGPYVKHNNLFVSLKEDDPLDIKLDKAISLIKKKQEFEKNKFIHIFDDHDPPVQVLNGPYGAYIKFGKKNIKIPKGTDPKTLTLKDCIALAEKKK